MMQPQQKPRQIKGWMVAVAVLIVVAGFVYWQVASVPPKPWYAKWRVYSYLKRQAGVGKFDVPFQFPSREEMNRAPSAKSEAQPMTRGPLTKKEFDALKLEYTRIKIEQMRMERTLSEIRQQLAGTNAPAATDTNQSGESSTNAPPKPKTPAELEKELADLQRQIAEKESQLKDITNDLWAFQKAWEAEERAIATSESNRLANAVSTFLDSQRQQMDEARTYATMYRVIGQELWVADRLLKAANPQIRRAGLGIARRAINDAYNYAQNFWLAARMVEAFYWPHIDAADDSGSGRNPLSVVNIYNEAANFFREADEPKNVVVNYSLMLKQAKTPQRRDYALVQLSFAHERAGDYPAALKTLKQVKATNDFAWAMRRLPMLEQRANR